MSDAPSARARSCPQCGATVELPENALADQCSFCETPLVDAAAAERHIDRVAPFEIERAVASKRLKQFLAGQWMAPEEVRHKVDPAKLNGVLVPFYAYDGTARTRWSAQVGIYWHETQTYTVVVNGKMQVRTRQVRHTEWFPLSGTHAANYSSQLVSASRGLPEGEANELEPFDLGKAVPFAPATVAGWQAERPTVDHAEAHAIAGQEIGRHENSAIAGGFLVGDTRSDVQSQTDLHVDQVEEVLLPVWIATYQHGGKVFRLLVNGQTGEIVGKAPRSSAKVGCIVLAVVGVVLGLLGVLGLAGAAGSLLR